MTAMNNCLEDCAAVGQTHAANDRIMQLYTCCPHESCDGFLKGLAFLTSFGIEPSLKSDGEHHFFEYRYPEGWSFEQKIEFHWELAQNCTGLMYCRCGQCLKECSVNAMVFTCRMCGREFIFCRSCDAFERWAGCDCQGESLCHRKES